ncbi:vWA domain-containing protein [Roseimaritima ulvae]|uniref:vWA domain-containing protein n=1 Tax=Roseimaritima ulvae TaxID=980254 RepID=UPI0011CD3D4B|nr:hypothetical protein [Roseimaritima ulvae]
MRSRATAARLEATVARLEARAAELQWLIDRATGTASTSVPPPEQPPAQPAHPPSLPAASAPATASATTPKSLDNSPSKTARGKTSPDKTVPTKTASGIRSWDELAAAVRRRRRPRDPDSLLTARPPDPSPAGTKRRRRRPEAKIRTTSVPPMRNKKRSAAWFVSMAIHVGLLLLLGVLTLSVHRPQDQLAFTATAAPSSVPEVLQTLQIESATTPHESDSDEPAERPLEIDPLGAIPLPSPQDLPALPTTVSSAPHESLRPLLDSHDMLTALNADTHNSTRFCGVESGGNHFVYIVDSSQSMKNGRFESARRELLQAIDALQPQQRFYIMFYDIHLDRMCVSNPNQADEYAVLASDENKRRARRWAMSVKLEQGAPPDEALSFALKLRPDVIFLLSDGEFPQRIEDLMAEKNRTRNLFGDAGPISILHTIGYHSRDGETRMRRLAEANGGQYRYIPAP